MTSSSEENVLNFVADFLKNKGKEISEISIDTDLYEYRLLSSIDFVEFLLLVEKETGKAVYLDQVSPDDFRSPGAIYRRFFYTA